MELLPFKGGGCDTPWIATDKDNNNVPVPCGKCPKCISRRVSSWSFRLMQEYKAARNAYFITLTYNTKEVPITNRGFMSLSKKHCQDFLKRLRKAQERFDDNVTIKYYLCGEYGSQTNRPHYHVIMFNVASILDVEKKWHHGEIFVGTVSEASVGYTLKYMSKEKKIPQHRRDDRVPEFSLMSKDWVHPILLEVSYDITRQTFSIECM